MRLIIFAALVSSALAQWDPNFVPGRAGIVHLFEWHWDTVADECETFLGPNGFAGVQISPPQENAVIDGRPWWERYQPVSYVLSTRSGDRDALIDMVQRCNNAGVRIYADVILNHMASKDAAGYGTGGSYFDATSEDFPAVPFTSADFNDANCQTGSGLIESSDAVEMRNCQLLGLVDLNQGEDYVRAKLADFLNDLTAMGIAGFRVDASKYIFPEDLDAILGSLNDLPTSQGFAQGSRPFVYQEVIEDAAEPVTASDYFGTGRVTEFKYGINLAKNKDSLQSLENLGESWGMVPDSSALVFVNNHDNQRGHGNAADVVTFETPEDLNILTAFMMAWPYGIPRVMSSYYFTTSDDGPPAQQRSVNADGSCGNGWVCEHRWTPIKNMAAFSAAAAGEDVANWWSGSNNRIAFSRGNKAFLAANKEGKAMSEKLQTGLPQGAYCDVASGDSTSAGCTGTCVRVNDSGFASINIQDGSFLALHVNAPCS